MGAIVWVPARFRERRSGVASLNASSAGPRER